MAGFDSSDEENDKDIDLTPLAIDWVDLSKYGCTEPLGISALPGCKFKDTWRSIESDIGTIQSHKVLDVFVLCTRGELAKYRVPWLLRDMDKAGITIHHYPFLDGGVPQLSSLLKMTGEMRVNLMKGRKTLVHCYGGLGRSCSVVGSLILQMDEDITVEALLDRLRGIRGPAAIQSIKQFNFLNDFRKNVAEFQADCEDPSRSISR